MVHPFLSILLMVPPFPNTLESTVDNNCTTWDTAALQIGYSTCRSLFAFPSSNFSPFQPFLHPLKSHLLRWLHLDTLQLPYGIRIFLVSITAQLPKHIALPTYCVAHVLHLNHCRSIYLSTRRTPSRPRPPWQHYWYILGNSQGHSVYQTEEL